MKGSDPWTGRRRNCNADQRLESMPAVELIGELIEE